MIVISLASSVILTEQEASRFCGEGPSVHEGWRSRPISCKSHAEDLSSGSTFIFADDPFGHMTASYISTRVSKDSHRRSIYEFVVAAQLSRQWRGESDIQYKVRL
jgi:hypothetical protein